MIDQVGPSAIPISARKSSSCSKLLARPEIHESSENANTAGIRITRRPKRSERAPKKKVDNAQVIAKAEASKPTCSCVSRNSGAMYGAR